MSFLSAADIVKGIEICKWIYEHCFSRIGRADARYLEFGKDLATLKPTLARLLVAFQRAIQLREYGPLDGDRLEREAKELIGDFNATLTECREILEDNRGVIKDGAGFVQNVIWGTSTQTRVDELRKRIQLHIQKIELFMGSVRLEQSNTIVDGIQEILYHARELRGLSSDTLLEPIPEWLHSRFREALDINPPPSYTDIGSIPLEHGFEALYHHYNQCMDLQTSNRTMERYLALLKAHWILQTLTRGAPFKGLRSGSCYPRAVARLSELIADQYARPGLATFSEDDLKKLNESSFLIWPVQKVVTPRQLTEPDGLEEKILEISLPTSSIVRKEDLLLFQRGPTTLRLARNTVPVAGPLRQQSEKINIHIDRFIPLYAVPFLKSETPPRLSIKICDGKDAGESEYEVKNEADLFSLQRAFTGFEVVSDVKKVDWSLNQKKMKLVPNLLANTGRMQVWFLNPLSRSRMFQAGSSERLDSEKVSSSWRSSTGSEESHRTNSTVAKVVNGQSKASFSTVQSDGDETVVALNTPPPPVLFIYSGVKGGYAFFHLELHPGLSIVETSCGCRKSKDSCCRTVLENLHSDTPKPFTVTRLDVKESQLYLWDLSIFGLPEHPLFKDSKGTEHLKCDFLSLDFPTVADRKRFNSHLRLAFMHRDKAQESFNRTVRRATYFSDRPAHHEMQHQAAHAATTRRFSSLSTASNRSAGTAISRVPSMAPSHAEVELVPDFANSVKTVLHFRG